MATTTITQTTPTTTTTPYYPAHPHPMTFDETVLTRHSARRFLPTPVPPQIITTALTLATHAPSNSNIQPWRLHILSGPPADRLKRALLAAANSSDAEPAIPPLPEAFAHFRSELGEEVFGVGLGIARSDTQARRAANLRNYDFFSAPVAVIVSMDRKLASVDAMTVGMYLQTFLLALTESGVASCVEVSVAGYPEVIRKELGIAENMDILCGVAVGYEDDTMKVNHLRTMRSAVEETTVLLNA